MALRKGPGGARCVLKSFEEESMSWRPNAGQAERALGHKAGLIKALHTSMRAGALVAPLIALGWYRLWFSGITIAPSLTPKVLPSLSTPLRPSPSARYHTGHP